MNKDAERGSILVQALLILPIFALAVFGGYEIWKVFGVKRSLHDGTYQAVRYLSLNPVDSISPDRWEEVAEILILRELENNPLAPRPRLDRTLDVKFAFDRGPVDEIRCGTEFTIETSLLLVVDAPFLSTGLNLRDLQEGEVACGGG